MPRLYSSDQSPVNPKVISTMKPKRNCQGTENPDGDDCDYTRNCSSEVIYNTKSTDTEQGVICEIN